jgi:hypothetical protein
LSFVWGVLEKNLRKGSKMTKNQLVRLNNKLYAALDRAVRSAEKEMTAKQFERFVSAILPKRKPNGTR